MKPNSMIAFFLTAIALVMILGLLGWLVVSGLPWTTRTPEYCEHFSVDLKPDSYSTILEIGHGKLIKVNITNNGFEDEFKINMDGPGWVVARPVKVRLGQGESGDIFVYMSPSIGSEGNDTVTVFAKSYCGMEKAEIKVKV